ncbi:hypothetical protein V6N13_018267 [Hibiscus sabdariffa]
MQERSQASPLFSSLLFFGLPQRGRRETGVAEHPERENHVPYISLEVVVKAALNVAGEVAWRAVLRNNQLMKRIVALYPSMDVIWPLALQQHLHS